MTVTQPPPYRSPPPYPAKVCLSSSDGTTAILHHTLYEGQSAQLWTFYVHSRAPHTGQHQHFTSNCQIDLIFLGLQTLEMDSEREFII